MKKCIYPLMCCIIAALFSTNTVAQTFSGSTYVMDSACGSVTCNAFVTGCTSGLTVKTFFGDGTASTTSSVYCSGGTGTAYIYHTYATSGAYTIKMILFAGTTALDSIISSHTVHYCRHMLIGSYLDANSNCIYDAGDNWTQGLATVEIDSSGVPIDTVSLYHGIWFTAYGGPGTIYGFRVLTPPPSLSLLCPSTGIIYDTIPALTTDPIPDKAFAFNCTSVSGFNLGIYGNFRPRPTGLSVMGVSVFNSLCSGATPATVRVNFSPKYSFSSLTPATYAYTVSTGYITIDMGTVSMSSNKSITLFFSPVGALTLGDTVNTTYTVFPITGDANTTNNIVVANNDIRASYDPNQKSVLPTGNIAAGTLLEYMLEFENTGNDTAYNIHIMDTLSNNLDINTLQIGVSTHQVNLLKYVYAGQNILKFDFANINLPDTSNPDKNKGLVTFSIRAKSTLPPGTIIANRVGIYFDVNPVVMTNTVYNQIPLPTKVKPLHGLSQVELYPNPVNDLLTVKAEVGAYKTLTIYNVVGQVINTQDVSNAEMKVDVHSLLPGIYYITLKGLNGTKTIKFEKQ